ncbi:MAG: hypothetical protein V4556_07875 [Bacteroidota bacterium]
MKKNLLLIIAIFLFNFCVKADFGIWASGVYLDVNGSAQFYSTLLQNDPNSIGTVNFGGSLGTFVANSGTLNLRGAEIKTYKSNGGNVCGGFVYYTVYPQGARPGSPVFSPISLGFFCDCSGGTFGGGCGGGSCTDNSDQKWQTVNQSNDLTALADGTYTLELYYQIPGSATSGSCLDTAYDSNGGNNYTANFTITTNLAVNFSGLTASSLTNAIKLKWNIENDVDILRYEIERSTNGIDFSLMQSVASVRATLLYNYTIVDNTPFAGKNFYRLKFYKIDNTISYSNICKIDLSNIGNKLIAFSDRSSNSISIRFHSIPKGNYELSMINNLGQSVIKRSIVHDGNDNNLSITPQVKLNTGIYRMVLRNNTRLFSTAVLIK